MSTTCNYQHSRARLATSWLFALLAVITASVLGYYILNVQKAHKGAIRSEQSLLAFLRETNTAIIEVDSFSVILGWNKAATDIFGFEAAEVLGKKLDIILPDGDDFATRHASLVRRSFDSSPQTHVVTVEARMKGGKPVRVTMRVFVPSRSSSQSAIAVISKALPVAIPLLPPAHAEPTRDKEGASAKSMAIPFMNGASRMVSVPMQARGAQEFSYGRAVSIQSGTTVAEAICYDPAAEARK